MTAIPDDSFPRRSDIHPAVRARARELHAWIDEFILRYGLDEDPTEVGPLQQAEFENSTDAIRAKYAAHPRRTRAVHVPAVVSAYEAVVLLLRRLAGRLTDSMATAAWTALADEGPSEAGPLLLAAVTAQPVRLTPAETRLFRDITADPAGFASGAEFSVDQDDVELLYYFDPWSEPRDEAAITRAGLDRIMADRAGARDDVRLVGRAWRSPARRHSPVLASWIYVVVTEPGARVADVRRHLATPAGPGPVVPYPVEVVEEGRDLPFYQAAARARARRIWPHNPHDTGIRTHHWLH
ncbi:hypothetical protein LO772_16610 [Yinghuangia sp. ASG 101]|uniref:hypothetical protein n=1 Tax=Yinghuangia sp. ASG 101 TaxID=2896848 RepID=UPI001E32C7E8|nr:hypothetical protein [Yinghuangia sp. ASG 101]UGQ15038.1 hypothetical protein LO772_16610 [Yinghuangia sp. ASG 101]